MCNPGLLQPLPTPNEKWKSINMDFITDLLNVDGKNCVYIVIDRLTKYSLYSLLPLIPITRHIS